jgi:hypothetical protein
MRGHTNRWNGHCKKVTVEDCHQLDAFEFRRAGILRAGMYRQGVWPDQDRSDSEQSPGTVMAALNYLVDTRVMRSPVMHLAYKLAIGVPVVYSVGLQTTRPHYGGLKWWFVCPLFQDGQKCGRRVRKLYLPSGFHFGCRHCYELSYQTRGMDARSRSLYKAQRIRLSLGGNPALIAPFPPKPKGMWDRTYFLRWDQARCAEAGFLNLSRKWLDSIEYKIAVSSGSALSREQSKPMPE